MPSKWDDTRVLLSEMTQYMTTARRTGDTWFVGSVNNEEAREIKLLLDFLDPAKTYEAHIFQDAEDSDGVKNPELYTTSTSTVKSTDTLTIKMAPGGGNAMILKVK